MTKSRRYIVALIVCIVALALVLAFYLRGPVASKVTLRVIGEDVPPLAALQVLAKKYEEQTGTILNIEKYEFQIAVQKATQDLTTGAGYYDIVLLPHLALGRFVESGGLMEIGKVELPAGSSRKAPSAQALFENVTREISVYKGRKFGLPYTANTMYVAYRRDLFDDGKNKTDFKERFGYELSPPQTWTQFRDIAEFFTRPSANLFGTALQAKRHPSVWYEWLNFAYSFGGGVLDSDRADKYGKVIINCPKSIAATEFYRSLTRFSPPDTSTYTWDEHLAAVQKGRVAMVIMWSDTVPSLENTKESTVAGKMAYSTVPVSPVIGSPMPQIAGWSYFISSRSKNQSRAADFVYWMMQPENQIDQQKLGGASALRATYADPEIKRIPYTEAYVRSLELARSMSSSFPETERVADEVQACISDAVASSTGDVKSILNACAVNIGRVLQAHPEAQLACPAD